jgi:hypothetical protein
LWALPNLERIVSDGIGGDRSEGTRCVDLETAVLCRTDWCVEEEIPCSLDRGGAE